MENKNIIIMLVTIIVILVAAIGVMLFNPIDAKEPTKIKITSDKEQYEGEKLTINLTDLNKTPISKENVKITVTNKKGKVVVNKTVKTNSKGEAKCDLNLKKGKYKVNVIYNGNENYAGNNTTQELTIIEEVVETEPEPTQQNEETSDDLGLSQHKVSDWEYTGTYADGEHYSDGSGGELVMHEEGQYEYYDGHGNVVGGLYE